MKVLTLTSLFPGSAAPRHGVFVKERMADYRDRCGAEIKVVSPVPYYPRFLPGKRYRQFAEAPPREEWKGFEVLRPRYAMIPKIGVPLQGLFYHAGVRGTVRRLRQRFPFDLIDAHYAYPDGFAAGLLKQRLGVPMVLTVRGTDVNLLPGMRTLRGQVRFALRSADAVVAVSAALAELAIEVGADPERVIVLRNGVDSHRFRPYDQAESRRQLGLAEKGRVLVTVGFLVERKGHHLILDALALLADEERPALVIAGDGPQEGALREQVNRLGLQGRVHFLGPVEHDDLPAVYSAGDLSVLASSREGWPNVLLESMACGTPALASAVHGSVEVLREPGVGLLLRERTAEELAARIRQGFASGFDREHVRRYAERMSWKETSLGLDRLFREVLDRASGRSGAAVGDQTAERDG